MASLEDKSHAPGSPEKGQELDVSGVDYQQLDEVETFVQEYNEAEPEDDYHKGTHACMASSLQRRRIGKRLVLASR